MVPASLNFIWLQPVEDITELGEVAIATFDPDYMRIMGHALRIIGAGIIGESLRT